MMTAWDKAIKQTAKAGRALVKESETAEAVTFIFCNGSAICRLIVPREMFNQERIKKLWARTSKT